MTFQQLTYVVEISKCGSINKAAHKLFLSQSGISTAVRELEEELGIKFFVRSNRGVEFTPEGKEFLGYAVSLLEQKQRIESLYGESRSTIAPVHFSVSTQRYPFTEDAFLEMLQQNQENRYQYTLKETSMDGVIDDVYDHRADIGVIFLTKLTEKIVCRLLQKLRRLQKLRARSAAQKCLHGSEGGAFPGSGAQRHGKKLSRLLQNWQHLLALVFFHRNQHLQQRQCVPRGKAVCKPQRRL